MGAWWRVRRFGLTNAPSIFTILTLSTVTPSWENCSLQNPTINGQLVALSSDAHAVQSVRTDNFPPLESQAQEQESNPEPGFPWATGPEDRETARPHFSGIKPLQADVEEDVLPRKVDQAKESTALSEVPITTPNGDDLATIGLIILKSSPATNQEPTQGRGTSPQLGPMTSMLKQDNQVAKLGAATNEKTPRPSAILLPLDPSPQFHGPALHNALMTPHKKC
ncbi:hypothetical protein DSO57_1014871 [Entomophthora muscae]|uniref:Uncharacterized protein n=1 Tax=Entomophthora muscae TaxID=34485 RepID=A0ACC2TT35_9FUNG|nr:hypothetical protein DSO57_1014871 [Entomophthora muscae]